MLAILSEVDCLDYLNLRGIYPDIYSTDFDWFKSYIVAMSDCNVLIILAGLNRFYRKGVIDFVHTLSNMDGVSDINVISDTYQPKLARYYKMRYNSLDILDEYHGWDAVKKGSDSDFLSSLIGEPKELTKYKLSDYDLGYFDDNIINSSINTKQSVSEAEFLTRIQVPVLS